MSLGRGLESLIPPKRVQGSAPKTGIQSAVKVVYPTGEKEVQHEKVNGYKTQSIVTVNTEKSKEENTNQVGISEKNIALPSAWQEEQKYWVEQEVTRSIMVEASGNAKTESQRKEVVSNLPQAEGKTPQESELPPVRFEDIIIEEKVEEKIQVKNEWNPSYLAGSESVFQIEVSKIKANPYQPRKEFKEEDLRDLAQSIREFGVIQPLIVSKIEREVDTGTEVEYQLIAGERRLRAARLVGLERVPAIVKKIDAAQVKLEIALIENIQRSDLNPVEAARAYARLQDEFGLTQREIAVRVGKSREVVANTLRLLNLPTHIQEALAENKINESQARLLLSVTSPEKQEEAFQNIMRHGLSVRRLKEKIEVTGDPDGSYWERQLEEYLGAPVKVMKQGQRGKMIIHFYSGEEWQSIIDKLLGKSDGV